MLSYIWNLIKWLLVLAVAFMVSVLSLPLFTPYRLLVVLSGSMAPTLEVGDAILVRSGPAAIQPNDIITFRREGQLVTHRVVEIGPGQFTTKGDANNAPDLEPVPSATVEGKFVLRLPFMGYFIYFARTPLGWLTLVVIPAAVLIAGEVKSLLAGRGTSKREGE